MSRSVDRHWMRARAYLQEGHVQAARAQWESLRTLAPGDPRTHIVAARVAFHEGHPQAAATHALEAAQISPDTQEVLAELIEVLLQVGETAAGHALIGHPLWQHSEDPEILLRYAGFRRRFGEHAQALAAFDRLLTMHPDDPALHHGRAQELQFLGRLSEAESAYEACLARAPGYGIAAYGLVRLRRQLPDDRRLALLEAGLEQTPPGSRAHADLEFARYHVLEDLGQFAPAWQALATANRSMHTLAAADAARELEGMQHLCRQAEIHVPRVSANRVETPLPIFIVGLPRSGTTVLERMLANHSRVSAAGELKDFGRQLLRVADSAPSYDAAFFERQLTLDFTEVGRGYLAQTRWRARDKPRFTDKQPSNCVVAGLIHAALPQARILHLVRKPMDSCFSIWRARFGITHAWSYDFDTLARYYRDYRRVMQRWQRTFPGTIMDVSYEELVAAPMATLRRVLEFCGLPWEAGCDDLTHNTAPVSTLSSAQVRESVHTRGIGQWRRYAAQLAGLESALAPDTR